MGIEISEEKEHQLLVGIHQICQSPHAFGSITFLDIPTCTFKTYVVVLYEVIS